METYPVFLNRCFIYAEDRKHDKLKVVINGTEEKERVT